MGCFVLGTVYEEEEEDYGYPSHMRQASLELNVTEVASPRGNNGNAPRIKGLAFAMQRFAPACLCVLSTCSHHTVLRALACDMNLPCAPLRG